MAFNCTKLYHVPKSQREWNEAMQSCELVKSTMIHNSHLGDSNPMKAVLPIPAIQITKSTKSHSTTIYNTMSPPQKLLHAFLQACYQLDITISAPTQTTLEEVMSWQSLDPLLYLSSPVLLSRWERDLELLCQQYLNGTFTPDMFERRLAAILPGVEQLGIARDKLMMELENELEKCGVDMKVPEVFWEAIEERCAVIDQAFLALERSLDSQNEQLCNY